MIGKRSSLQGALCSFWRIVTHNYSVWSYAPARRAVMGTVEAGARRGIASAAPPDGWAILPGRIREAVKELEGVSSILDNSNT